MYSYTWIKDDCNSQDRVRVRLPDLNNSVHQAVSDFGFIKLLQINE